MCQFVTAYRPLNVELIPQPAGQAGLEWQPLRHLRFTIGHRSTKRHCQKLTGFEAGDYSFRRRGQRDFRLVETVVTGVTTVKDALLPREGRGPSLTS